MHSYNETKLLKTMSLIPILILIFISIIFSFIIISNQKKQLKKEIITIKNDYINNQKKLVKKEVIKIINIIQSEYYQDLKEQNARQSIKDIKKHILKVIEAMEYDDEGYIFIVDYDGNFLINIKQSLVLKKQINSKDKTDFNIKKEIIATAKKKDGGYIQYIKTYKTPIQKISYVKSFEPLKWCIGYGFYPNDIENTITKKVNQLKKEHKKHLTIIFSTNITILITLTIVLLIFSRIIKNIFNNYKNKLSIIEKTNEVKNQIIYHQSKMVTIGELLNMIAHQWRQPLSEINSITLSMYIEQKNGSLDQKALKENINDIENITQYLSQTIDDFSDFFVPEKEAQVFKVNDAIKNCINIIKPSIKHINLSSNYQSQSSINGYITLFQQVIISIITNSLDAFKEKNIINPCINIDIYDKDQYVYVEISDNARGISIKDIDHIFKLYFSTKKNKPSRGLGLYIVEKIIKQHFKGTILANNIKDGVVFIIKVPK